MTLRAEAFAKVNRSLRVLGEREDGYHELDTVFQTIDLSDTLEVEPGDGTVEIEIEGGDPSVPADERNLVARAATLLAGRFGVTASARVHLRKKIPAGAGLGGGSSDAAVALNLFARLWELRLSREAAFGIALELGSDVPFFLLGGSARATGRGEKLTSLPDGPGLEILLVIPPFSLSTSRVYEQMRRRGGADSPSERRHKESSEGGFFGENDLAPAVLEVEPKLQRYWDILAEHFRDCAISGSGSCLAALVDGGGRETRGETTAKRVAELHRALPEARILLQRTVSRSEYRRRSTVDFHKEVMNP
jgi:4-diphosphocytidyl-2-C-methyl-D-erythritol kinase